MNKKSVRIAAVILLLAGIVIYLLTFDLSEEPNDDETEVNRAAAPAAASE